MNNPLHLCPKCSKKAHCRFRAWHEKNRTVKCTAYKKYS